MITVDVLRDVDGRVYGFRSRGHAHGKHGTDIVCAAVSAITQTAVLGLMHHLHLKPAVAQSPGYLECVLQTEFAAADRVPTDTAAEGVLETMVLGLAEVARQYPEQVRVRNVQS